MTPQEFYSIVRRDDLKKQVLTTPTPAYLFFEDVIRSQISRLRRTVGPRFRINYAMKANPHPDVLRVMRELDLGIDVASGGELATAIDAGFDPRRIEFSGPGKTRSELQLAMGNRIGCINVESLGEIEVVAGLLKDEDWRVPVGIRLNPDIDVRAGLRMGSAPQFGVPSQDVETAVKRLVGTKGIDFVGVSMHVGSQILEADAVLSIVRIGLGLAKSVFRMTGRPLKKLNFGGGWGVNYFDGQAPLNLGKIAAGISDVLANDEYASALESADLILEPGRFLVAESGVYASRVLYRKRAGDKEIAVVDGGLNSNYLLAGGMGQVIRRNFQLDVISWKSESLTAPDDRFTVAGCLCTPQDILAQDVQLNTDIHPGDCVVFFNCGAYGATASPLRFLNHPEPTQVMVSAQHNSEMQNRAQ